MALDQFEKAFAESTAAAFEALYPDVTNTADGATSLGSDNLSLLLERPKDPLMGHTALPVFRFAKLLKKKPPEIAAEVAEKATALLTERQHPLKCSSVAGFINCQVDPEVLAEKTIEAILSAGSAYGSSDQGTKQKVLVEYSSPNIAKPFTIGHLRSTVVGNSLRRIFLKLGYDTTGINYLGDWGTQFGKVIVAYRRWGEDLNLEQDGLKKLVDLYVRFHKEAEEDPGLETEAREQFRLLESGDPDATALWKRFREVSLAEFEASYRTLWVDYDWITGESFFNDKMEPVIDRLKAAGLTSISEGALVIELDDPNLPPLLLKKGDGGTLYATRELASFFYRWEKYHFDQSLYVVGAEQSDHFKQALMAIAKIEDAEALPETERMSHRVKHIDFGWVRFEDQRQSTRRGNIVFLEDVYQTATEKAREIIQEKNPDLESIDEVALTIGLGAVVFAQLSVRRQKDVNLVWRQILSFEGETGPYLQYTHARLCSLKRKFDREVIPEIDHSLLGHDEERVLIELLSEFPRTIEAAARVADPQVIAGYLLRLAGAFNKFYQRKDESGRIEKIISDDDALTAARMALVESVRIVLGEGLRLLAIRAPEAM